MLYISQFRNLAFQLPGNLYNRQKWRVSFASFQQTDISRVIVTHRRSIREPDAQKHVMKLVETMANYRLDGDD